MPTHVGSPLHMEYPCPTFETSAKNGRVLPFQILNGRSMIEYFTYSVSVLSEMLT